MTQKRTLGFYLGRVAAYTLLIGFAFVMLFPFLYMVSTSLKRNQDVVRFPPQLLPYSPVQREFNGELKTVYLLEVDGVTYEMVLTGERQEVGQFTTTELVSAERLRDSAIVGQVVLSEAVKTGETFTTTRADGTTTVHELYRAVLDDDEGERTDLILVSSPRLNEFVAIDFPDIKGYAVERTTTKLEFVEFQIQNYQAVLELDLDRALVNTTLVTLLVVAGQLVTSIFGGYAFSRVEFRGRNTLFLVYLGSIMIPFVVLIIPMYRLMVLLDWQGRMVSLIVPWVFTAYGTFLIRQFFISIPKEIEEAALLDGCSRLRVLWQIFVPLSTPAIATLAIFSFLYAWNSFLWPLLIIGEGNVDNHVLTLSLIRLANQFVNEPNLVLTGAAIAILPPVIVFVFAQRYFIEGVAAGGVKG